MSDDKSGQESNDKSWIEKIALAFSTEPKTRADLGAILSIARDNEVIDDDAHEIIEGAMKVAEMQARDIMVQRPQMEVIKADAEYETTGPQDIEFRVPVKQGGSRVITYTVRYRW